MRVTRFRDDYSRVNLVEPAWTIGALASVQFLDSQPQTSLLQNCHVLRAHQFMAASKRRSSRTNGNAARSSSLSDVEDTEPTKPSSKDEETCPACTKDRQLEDEEQWAMCGICKVWYHWRCAGTQDALSTIDKW